MGSSRLEVRSSSRPLGVKLRSDLPGVSESGLLPFQEDGVRFMQTQDRCVYFYWSTGTGKTLAAEATILWKRQNWQEEEDGGFDLCLYCVKPNNLTGALRKLRAHTGLDAQLLLGSPKRRFTVAEETASLVEAHEQPILIFNPEKYREDTELLKILVESARVLTIFDEMPSKFSNRGTALYKKTAEVLYTSFVTPNRGKSKKKQLFYPREGWERADSMFSVILSATPIYNSPEDTYNNVRLVDPGLVPSVAGFEKMFIAGRDPWGKPASWKDLDLFHDMIKPIVHHADKYSDPTIRDQFPEELPPEIVWLELDPNTQKLYDKLAKQYEKLGIGMLDYDEILSAISCMRMLCCNPRAVLLSAAKYEWYLDDREAFLNGSHSAQEVKEFDRRNRQGSEVALKLVDLVNNDALFTDRDSKGNCILPKLLDLRDRLGSHGDKAIVYTTFNELSIPLISEWFNTWGISHVSFHGGLSQRARDEQIGRFREDESVQVFLSNDAGADSIDLPEASLTVHYDLPYTEAIKRQRKNRMSRIDSKKEIVQEITLLTPHTAEERVLEIVQIKAGYELAVFHGQAVESKKVTKDDLYWALTGRGRDD